MPDTPPRWSAAPDPDDPAHSTQLPPAVAAALEWVFDTAQDRALVRATWAALSSATRAQLLDEPGDEVVRVLHEAGSAQYAAGAPSPSGTPPGWHPFRPLNPMPDGGFARKVKLPYPEGAGPTAEWVWVRVPDAAATVGELLNTAIGYDAPLGARVTFTLDAKGFGQATSWTWPTDRG
jgi:hypothetical protein